MSYQLTDILKRCTKEDADFLIATIDSYVNFTDDKGLKEINDCWTGEDTMPLALNRKLEREIRYLGSNDLAYLTRKMRGYDPAGVSVDEIIDDLCELLKIEKGNAGTLEARLEIFAGKLVDQQFAKLSDERKREILNQMHFEKHHRDEIINRVVNNKELLLPVVLPVLGKTVGPEVLQGLIISIIAPFIGTEAAKQILIQIVSKFPIFGAWLGPLLMAGGAGWLLVDLAGPASRKTIPLILYLGVLCLRDGESRDFKENFNLEK